MSQQYATQEFIFDGVSDSPDIADQGMDMHSFYDGEFIWYPSVDLGSPRTNNILKYNPKTGVLRKIELLSSGGDLTQAYQAIQGQDSDTIWIYSTYGTRAIWKFSKENETSTYRNLNTVGSFGGKIISIMLGGVEQLITTIITTGYPVVYNPTDNDTAEFDDLGLNTYGIQTDGTNIFIADGVTPEIQAFTITDTGTEYILSDRVTIPTIGALDIAWDGEFIWTASSTDETAVVEKFLPVYTGEIVTSFVRQETHYTGSPKEALPASVKANAKYVGVAWEGSFQGTLGWSILNRETGVWEDFWNAATSTTVPESVYPFTDQYWSTVCIEIDVPNAIYITGYAPALQGDYMEESACPNSSMRLLKLTIIGRGSTLSNGTLSNAILS